MIKFLYNSYNHNHLYVYQATKAIGFNIGGVNFNPGEPAESTVEFFAGLFGRRRRWKVEDSSHKGEKSKKVNMKLIPL